MADSRRSLPIGITSRALSTMRRARPFVAAAMLFAATGQAHATTADFRFLGTTFTTPSLNTDGVIVTGSADVYVYQYNGLGIVGGLSSQSVEFGEFISFSFTSPSVTDVELSIPYQFGNGTANVDIEAFQPGGASLGTQTVDLWSTLTPWDVSAVFGDVPLESFTLTPLNTNVSSTSTRIRVSMVSFVPEPSTSALLLASGLAAVAATRTRRTCAS